MKDDKGYMDELFYLIALTRAEQIGDHIARKLLQEFGTAGNVFKASARALAKIEGLGSVRIQSLQAKINERAVYKEIDFIQKHDIRVHSVLDKDYPSSLKQIPDAPLLLFSKGEWDYNHPRKLAIVGTRNNTDYGKEVTESLIEQLIPYGVQVISGMAYGIDIIAHRQCVQMQIPTVGVLAHGLDKLYPSAHAATARKMLSNGALVTEFSSGTRPDRQNFPIRNRIVAGMSDMVLVIESKTNGGAMITAKIALAYNREVGALPGRIHDEKSRGCNYLIKSNMAHAVESAEDIAAILNWSTAAKQRVQTRLFAGLNSEESELIEVMRKKSPVHIDELMIKTGKTYSVLASLLLHLELQGAIKPMSGNRYQML